MTEIRYQHRIVAHTRGQCVLPTAEIAGLPGDDPLRRFVAAMCAYAAEVDAGRVRAPYSDDMAAHHARMTLIPVQDLLFDLDAAPRQLAERFGVPQEQILLRLRELRHPWPPPGA